MPSLIANAMHAMALRLGLVLSISLQTHRPGLSGPFKCVSLTAQTSSVSYGLTIFDDGRLSYHLDHHPVDRLPDDDVSSRLMATYHDHRDLVREYLQTQAYDLWHTLTTKVEACSQPG